MDENTIPITRPQSQHSAPNVVKQVIENDIPQQFVEKTKYPTETIDLPSKGWFYPLEHPLSSGKIELKMPTAREEDILTSQNLINKGIVLKRLLDSLIVDKRVKQDDILLCDMNGIFVAIRRLAYGDQYGPLKIKCPHCGESNEHTVDLSTIDPKPFDFNKFPQGQNSFDYTLPISKKVITYKILSQKEDDMAELEDKNMAKLNKDRSTSITTRLKHIIQAVDGDDDKVVIRKFVDEVPSKDSLNLRKHVKENVPDLDMSFEFTCNSCNNSGRMEVPMTVQFFWPNT